jgi:hypothetical protein
MMMRVAHLSLSARDASDVAAGPRRIRGASETRPPEFPF